MADTSIEARVSDAYAKRKYTDVVIIDQRRFSNGDTLVALEGKDAEGDEMAEICLVSRDDVRIFDGDVDLINGIERPSRLLEWLISGHGISALAFLTTLVALIGFGLARLDDKPAFDVIKQICLLAAGFFLGNQMRDKP